MFLYQVFEENSYHDEMGCYTTFGVAVYDDKLHRTVMSISNVFPINREKADKFVETFNKLQLEPIHLLDVLEDIL
jgi:hypothetical protein